MHANAIGRSEDAYSGVKTLHFHAADVTGTYTADASVQSSLPTSAVVSSLVRKMALPTTVPYGLRDEATGGFLDEDTPIGEQLKPGAMTTVTPKTHLG